MRRQLVQFFRATVLCGAITAAAGGSVGAISAGGIGGRPANPDPANPRTQSIFIMTLDRGESKNDTVRVVNGTDAEQTIQVYAVDGMVTNTGAYTCRQEGDPRTGLGGWIRLEKNEVTLSANSSVDVDFTVQLPENANVGEHNGCIVFQTASQGAAKGGGVNIQMRQALRVVATVPGELHREVSLDSFSASMGDSVPRYSLSIKNVGNVSVDTDVKVTLISLFGKEVYKNGGGYPVLANQKLDLNYEQKDFRPLFGGWYKAQAAVKYNKKAGTFGVDASQQNMATIWSEEKTIYIPPSSTGMIIIASIFLIAVNTVGYLLWRRSASRKSRQRARKHKVVRGETIQSIAEDHKVGWKKIAALNSLKPPYVLEEGQVIHVPSGKRKRT